MIKSIFKEDDDGRATDKEILQGLIENRDNIQWELDNTKKKIAELEAKHIKLKGDLPRLERTSKQLAAEKKNILDKFVMGEANKDDTQKARENYNRALQVETETAEMIDAIERALNKIRKEAPDFHNRLLIANRKLWEFIYEDIKAKDGTALADKLLNLYVAKLQTGGADLLNVLNDLIGRIPPPETVKNIQAKLSKKYIGKGIA